MKIILYSQPETVLSGMIPNASNASLDPVGPAEVQMLDKHH